MKDSTKTKALFFVAAMIASMPIGTWAHGKLRPNVPLSALPQKPGDIWNDGYRAAQGDYWAYAERLENVVDAQSADLTDCRADLQLAHDKGRENESR